MNRTTFGDALLALPHITKPRHMQPIEHRRAIRHIETELLEAMFGAVWSCAVTAPEQRGVQTWTRCAMCGAVTVDEFEPGCACNYRAERFDSAIGLAAIGIGIDDAGVNRLRAEARRMIANNAVDTQSWLIFVEAGIDIGWHMARVLPNSRDEITTLLRRGATFFDRDAVDAIIDGIF